MPHVAPRTPQEARTGGSQRRTRDGVDAFVKAFAALLKVGSLTRTDSSVSASVDTLADVRGGILPEVWAALAELRVLSCVGFGVLDGRWPSGARAIPDTAARVYRVVAAAAISQHRHHSTGGAKDTNRLGNNSRRDGVLDACVSHGTCGRQ